MSEESRPRRPAPPDTAWAYGDVQEQIKRLCADVTAERHRQEAVWGRQNIRDLQPGSNGVRETGRPYRHWEQVLKYQCDRARDSGSRSMDLVLLEEVFEALAKAVELSETGDPEQRAKLGGEMVTELIQVAAVSVKWAGIIERGEPRHG